jgi:hypothetical protein
VVNEHGSQVASSQWPVHFWVVKRGRVDNQPILATLRYSPSIVHDLESSESEFELKNIPVVSLLEERSINVVRWDGYVSIEIEERNRRRSESQPREKITDIDVMLKTAKSIQTINVPLDL